MTAKFAVCLFFAISCSWIGLSVKWGQQQEEGGHCAKFPTECWNWDDKARGPKTCSCKDGWSKEDRCADTEDVQGCVNSCCRRKCKCDHGCET